MRLIFMGTPDFAVPTLLELAARRARDRGGLYARGQARRPRHGVAADARSSARRGGSACRYFTPKTLKNEAGASRIPRASGRRGGGGRLWPDPAEADFGSAAARLLQRACLAAAALARRGADQPRHHGRRCGNRRHHHADGRRARHRRHGDGRAHRHSARHDRRRPARRAGAARRRSDAARACRSGTRLVARLRRSPQQASPMPPRSARTRPASIGPSPGARCTTTSAGCRRFLAPGSRSPAYAHQGAALDQGGRATGTPGTLLDDRLTIACGDGAVRLTQVQRAGKQPMVADEFLRGHAAESGNATWLTRWIRRSSSSAPARWA